MQRLSAAPGQMGPDSGALSSALNASDATQICGSATYMARACAVTREPRRLRRAPSRRHGHMSRRRSANIPHMSGRAWEGTSRATEPASAASRARTAGARQAAMSAPALRARTAAWLSTSGACAATTATQPCARARRRSARRRRRRSAHGMPRSAPERLRRGVGFAVSRAARHCPLPRAARIARPRRRWRRRPARRGRGATGPLCRPRPGPRALSGLGLLTWRVSPGRARACGTSSSPPTRSSTRMVGSRKPPAGAAA